VGSWEKRYKELQQYINDHGDPHVPTKFKENRALGRWVSTQRNMYKKFREQAKFNNLDTTEILRRIRLLDRLGFSWTMSGSSGSDSAGGYDSGGHYHTDDNRQRDDAPFDEV
jgi:Helicase associated domain